VVGRSARLADRVGLAADMDDAPEYDVLLTELKAAAVDIACGRALERGAGVVFCDNRAVVVDGDPGGLTAAIRETTRQAERRYEQRQ
jgi:cyclic 2,3-diphosphoglycerate synthase